MKRAVLVVLAATMICAVVAGFVGLYMSGWYSTPLVHPGRPHESLWMSYTRLNSPTNMSLNVLNCGNYPATPVSYYVTDPSGKTYANPNWSTSTIPLMANVTLSILIDGNAFTFQHGFPYTINLNTQRVHYTFSVTP